MAGPPPLRTEAAFRQWYAAHATRLGLSPDPDAPSQQYDYRAAYRAGAEPNAAGHWPSTFKRGGHPRVEVGGFDTRTGQRVPGTPQAGPKVLTTEGWDPADAQRLGAGGLDLLPSHETFRALVAGRPRRTP